MKSRVFKSCRLFCSLLIRGFFTLREHLLGREGVALLGQLFLAKLLDVRIRHRDDIKLPL